MKKFLSVLTIPLTALAVLTGAIALPLLVVFAVVGALLPLLLPLALVAAAFCILKKA